MSVRTLLQAAASYAADHLEALEDAPVGATATLEELRGVLGRPLPEAGTPAEQVLEELVRDVQGGILGSAGGRFFGWVIGGAVPAALGADWLTAAWDQNAALYACAPAAAVIEEVAGQWLKELLGLPAAASFAFTSGAQMAHVTALAAARDHLLRVRGIDVERHGLAGAPDLRVLTSGAQHGSIDRAIRLLGIGSDRLRPVASDSHGRIDVAALSRELGSDTDTPSIVCTQAGEINTGGFDAFAAICEQAHARGAWVHVDGAFGLWAATSPRLAHLTAGIEAADSWTTDAHKWLNVPFDSGLAFVRDARAHRAAMTTSASYLIAASDSSHPTGAARDQIDWNPEWSRRGRGVPVYAAVRELGREGIRDIVDRCCEHARGLVQGIGALPGTEVLVTPEINQGLVRFLDPAGEHDRRTDEVVEAVRASGEAWFGATTWNGIRAMRVSVVNWQTGTRDVERAINAVRKVLAGYGEDGRSPQQ